jgi:hypothetical protein
MNSLRKHLSYANFVATMALVFAMTGTAIAAKHYLITSTSQISPKVLKALKGRTGATGSAGANGAPGAGGVTGPHGAEGPAGLSALATLPSGQTEGGTFGLRGTAIVLVDSATFPIPLKDPIADDHIVVTAAADPVTHCSGPRHADPGYMCVYTDDSANITQPPEFYDTESELKLGTSRVGFLIQILFPEPKTEEILWGSYAVTGA